MVVHSFSYSLLLTILLASCAVHRPPSDIEHRQQDTLAAMRRIGGAASAYAIDNCSFPRAKSIDELRTLVEPFYIDPLPRLDGWGKPFVYKCVKRLPEGCSCERFVLASGGADGKLDPAVAHPYTDERSSTNPDDDIVMDSRMFVRWPKQNAPAPRAADLVGTYRLTAESRAALAKQQFAQGVGLPDLPPGAFAFKPGVIDLRANGSFITDNVPPFDEMFFVYGGEHSLKGDWRLLEKGPSWFLVLHESNMPPAERYGLRVVTDRKTPMLELEIAATNFRFEWEE